MGNPLRNQHEDDGCDKRDKGFGSQRHSIGNASFNEISLESKRQRVYNGEERCEKHAAAKDFLQSGKYARKTRTKTVTSVEQSLMYEAFGSTSGKGSSYEESTAPTHDSDYSSTDVYSSYEVRSSRKKSEKEITTEDLSDSPLRLKIHVPKEDSSSKRQALEEKKIDERGEKDQDGQNSKAKIGKKTICDKDSLMESEGIIFERRRSRSLSLTMRSRPQPRQRGVSPDTVTVIEKKAAKKRSRNVRTAKEARKRGEEIVTENSCARTAFVYNHEERFDKLTEAPDGYIRNSQQNSLVAVYPCPKRQDCVKERPEVFVKRSRIHGKGLFARGAVLKGRVITSFVGEVIRKTVSDVREFVYQGRGMKSVYMIEHEGFVIDCTRKGGAGRFINHCCVANSEAKEKENELVVIATSDIEEGEEITMDYGSIISGLCRCGVESCRGWLGD